jgi:hypothetical protein
LAGVKYGPSNLIVVSTDKSFSMPLSSVLGCDLSPSGTEGERIPSTSISDPSLFVHCALFPGRLSGICLNKNSISIVSRSIVAGFFEAR